jgi:hypothetical protein
MSADPGGVQRTARPTYLRLVEIFPFIGIVLFTISLNHLKNCCSNH